ncbi:MAG: hypothetical protein R2747_09750 [Pyrinomonadaceae bacterium]
MNWHKSKNRRALFWKFLIFRLFQKNLETKKIIEDEMHEDESDPYKRIRCPLCKWQPVASSRWYCVSVGFPEHFPDGCGTVWNTFDTRGKCPGCNHQWRWTTCLYCHRESLHEDWYEKDEGGS